jgi:predicted HAD superfamily Cof-like phosphohydrolase
MLKEVKEFHEVFGHPVNAKETHELIELRFNLIREEWEETADELANLDLQVRKFATDRAKTLTKVRLTKELADMLYVIYGTAVALGLPLEEAFKETHRSNMSKLGEDGKPILREDGKVLKGPNFTQANIQQFFELPV